MLIVNRDEHKTNYTCISNRMIYDKRLSFAVKGFLVTLLSFPDDWNFTIRGMAELTGVSKDAIQRHLNELRENGYLQVMDIKGETNLMRKCYTVNEISCPQNKDAQNKDAQNKDAQNKDAQNKDAQNKPQINTNKQNTNKPNTNKPNTEKGEEGEKEINSDVRANSVLSPQSLQINADELAVKYGQDEIDRLLMMIANSGMFEDTGRVFPHSTNEDFNAAVNATSAHCPEWDDNYFLTTLFRITERRLRLEAMRAAAERS